MAHSDIKHVIVLMLEVHLFEHCFGFFRAANRWA